MSLLRFMTALAWLMLLAVASGLGAEEPAEDLALTQSLRAEVEAFVAADRIAMPEACQILFIGSSSIVKWRATLAQDMAPLPVINRGFGSSQIQYINRWFDELVAAYRPRAVVFYAGENDLHAGKSPSRVIADFDEFLGRKAAALGDTPVYFISIKPSKARFGELSAQSEVNAGIRARAARRLDLHYLDVASAMLERGRPRDLFEPDGLHMTRAGYQLWIPLVRSTLLAATGAQAIQCRQRAVHAAPHSD